MFSKKRIVLLGVAGLVALILFASLITGVFAQTGSTPTPTVVSPMATPGAPMFEVTGITVATPMTHEQMMPGTEAVTSTMPMTREQMMPGMHDMEAMTSTMPMTMTGPHQGRAAGDEWGMMDHGWGMGYHGPMTGTMPMTSTGAHRDGAAGGMCAMMKDGECSMMGAMGGQDRSTDRGMMSDMMGMMDNGQGMMKDGQCPMMGTMGSQNSSMGNGKLSGMVGMMGGGQGMGKATECPIMDDGKDAMGTMGGMSGMGQVGGMDMMEDEKSAAGTERLTAEEVTSALDDYLARRYEPLDFKVADLLEFDKAFYARLRETTTGANAFELTVDPTRGTVGLEQGPGTLWNAKYGEKGGVAGLFSQGGGGEGFGQVTVSGMPVTPEQARRNAQSYLSARRANLKVGEPQAFYGYYTFPLTNVDDKLVGLISVNGYTGRVWHHAWLGKFIGPAELP